MRYVLSMLLVALFLAIPGSLPDRGVPFLYQFFHANVFHLLGNLLGVWTVFRPGRKGNVKVLVLAYLISVVVWPLSAIPVIGISNLLFAAIGLRTPAFKSPWWRSMPVKIFLAVTVVLGCLPQVAGLTHVASFVLGCLIAAGERRLNRLDNEINRAAGC